MKKPYWREEYYRKHRFTDFFPNERERLFRLITSRPFPLFQKGILFRPKNLQGTNPFPLKEFPFCRPDFINKPTEVHEMLIKNIKTLKLQ